MEPCRIFIFLFINFPKIKFWNISVSRLGVHEHVPKGPNTPLKIKAPILFFIFKDLWLSSFISKVSAVKIRLGKTVLHYTCVFVSPLSESWNSKIFLLNQCVVLNFFYLELCCYLFCWLHQKSIIIFLQLWMSWKSGWIDPRRISHPTTV